MTGAVHSRECQLRSRPLGEVARGLSGYRVWLPIHRSFLQISRKRDTYIQYTARSTSHCLELASTLANIHLPCTQGAKSTTVCQ